MGVISQGRMLSSTKTVWVFLAVVVFVVTIGLLSVFVIGLNPRLVVPVAAMAVAVSVFVFTLRFNAATDARSASEASLSSQQASSNTGVAILKVLIIAALCIGALNVVTFAIEASKGTLDAYELRRFIPKAAFGLVLIAYVLRKIRSKTSP